MPTASRRPLSDRPPAAPGRKVRVGDHLIGLALAEAELVVGLDFGFSLPLWFLDP